MHVSMFEIKIRYRLKYKRTFIYIWGHNTLKLVLKDRQAFRKSLNLSQKQFHAIGICKMPRDVVSQIYRCSITSKENQW